MGKLSIITKAKRQFNKGHKAILKEIDARFEDLDEDIDFLFDELENKLSYKLKLLIIKNEEE